jgi:hypothetical protein
VFPLNFLGNLEEKKGLKPQLQLQHAVLKGKSRMLVASDGSINPRRKKKIIGVRYGCRRFERLDVRIGFGINCDSARGIISLLFWEKEKK